MSFGGPLAGRVKASNAVIVMGVCLFVAAIAFIMTPRLQTLNIYLAITTLCGAFLGIANALTLVATQAVVRPEIAGVASGLTKTVITLAAGFGVVLSGQSADQALGLLSGHIIQSTLVNTGICCLGAFGILTLWWMTRRHAA
jgi:predicted MFS family arabinose efflux permease